VVVVSPDLGSVTRARNFADRLDIPLAIIDKRRPKANVAEVMNIIGDIKDKKIILVMTFDTSRHFPSQRP
jgi:ribose-phosphate pyrophosphokinase